MSDVILYTIGGIIAVIVVLVLFMNLVVAPSYRDTSADVFNSQAANGNQNDFLSMSNRPRLYSLPPGVKSLS